MRQYIKPTITIIETMSETILNSGSVSDGEVSLESIPSGGSGGTKGEEDYIWGDSKGHNSIINWEDQYDSLW